MKTVIINDWNKIYIYAISTAKKLILGKDGIRQTSQVENSYIIFINDKNKFNRKKFNRKKLVSLQDHNDMSMFMKLHWCKCFFYI